LHEPVEVAGNTADADVGKPRIDGHDQVAFELQDIQSVLELKKVSV